MSGVCVWAAGRRVWSMDGLDARFGGVDFADSLMNTESRILMRAKALRTRLEAANAELYQCGRLDIVRVAGRVGFFSGCRVQRARMKRRPLSLVWASTTGTSY
jgi:hypothetical protein